MNKKIKNKRKIRVLSAAFGDKIQFLGFDPNKLGGMMSGAGSLIGNMGGQSTATTGGEAAMQSVQGILSGAGSGAQIGAAFGPAGAIVGGAAGALTGLVGKSGKRAGMTSFTDYDEGTLGTGLIGAFKNKKLRRERNRIKMNAINNQAAVQGTEDLANDYEETVGDVNTNTFEAGGQIPNSLAYVDDGEIIAQPDGTIGKVPEQGQPTDSNLVSLPVGSRVLSNTLKVPGTKKTFSELGEQMMTTKISKGRGRYAENANKLNEMNNNMLHDKLFNLQESIKNKRGIRNKDKAIPTAQYGVEIPEVTIIGKKSAVMPQMAPLNVGKFLRDNTTNIDDITIPRAKENQLTAGIPTASGKQSKDMDWVDGLTNGLSNLGALAPIMSNLFTKSEKPVSAVLNPYASSISRTMGGRRYDIEPARRAILENQRSANYNANQMNTNTGASMAFRLANAVGANKAVSDLYSQKSNIENQYKGEYANTMNNLGQQWVGTTNTARDINARNKAAAQNIRRTGLGQLSQWGQNLELMKNQKNMDTAMMKLYSPFLQAGFTAADLEGFKKWLKRGGKK